MQNGSVTSCFAPNIGLHVVLNYGKDIVLQMLHVLSRKQLAVPIAYRQALYVEIGLRVKPPCRSGQCFQDLNYETIAVISDHHEQIFKLGYPWLVRKYTFTLSVSLFLTHTHTHKRRRKKSFSEDAYRTIFMHHRSRTLAISLMKPEHVSLLMSMETLKMAELHKQ